MRLLTIKLIFTQLITSLFILSNSGCANSNKDAEIANLREENAKLRAQLEGRSSASKPKAETVADPTSLTNVLEIQKLKVYQSYTYVHIDFRLTNKSEQFIQYWQINADVLARDGKYLANGMVNGENLQSGQSVTKTILLPEVNSKEIVSWKPRIERVVLGGAGGGRTDATRYFGLREYEP